MASTDNGATFSKPSILPENPATQFIEQTTSGTNATGLVIDNQLVVAYEVKGGTGKNSIGIAQMAL